MKAVEDRSESWGITSVAASAFCREIGSLDSFPTTSKVTLYDFLYMYLVLIAYNSSWVNASAGSLWESLLLFQYCVSVIAQTFLTFWDVILGHWSIEFDKKKGGTNFLLEKKVA